MEKNGGEWGSMHAWGKEREQRESVGESKEAQGNSLGWWGRMVEGVGNCSSVAEDKFYELCR